jgi:hypothetical protein
VDIDLLLEAEKRGLLPPEKVALLQEARSRGLIGAPPKPQEPERQTRSAGDELGRQAGFTARYALEGPLSLFNAVVGDPVNTAINYGIRGINAITPTKLSDLVTGKRGIPELAMPSAAMKRAYDQAFPVAETGAEEVSGAISKAIAGGGPLTGAAQRASQATQAAVPMIRAMAARPVADLAAQGIGAGASEVTRQAGGGPVAQAIAGALTPTVATSTANIVGRGAGALNDIRRPLTQGGSEQIAGDLLGRLAQNKQSALRNLERYNQLVASGAQVGSPGFKPTAGAVAADYGLLGGQQAISRGDAAPQFEKRFAANTEAHTADLGKLNATEKAVAFYEKKRDDITGPLREKAFAPVEAAPGYFVQRHVDFTPVAEKIGAIAATAAGGKAESQRALKWIAERLDKYAAESRTDPANAYALHQDIGDLVKGKIGDEKGAIRLVAGLATEIKKTLGMQIEQAAPGFNNYLEHYARLSKPIDRLTVITERLGGQDLSRITNATPSITDNGASYFISQAKMKNALTDIKANTRLAPAQSDVLDRVLGGMNAETFASRAGKQPGSDTYQNIASANFVNRMLGDTLGSSGLGKAIQAPFNFVNRPFESQINDLIVQAYQDPKLMEKLLRKSRTQRDSPTLAGLLQSTGESSGMGLLGSLFSR